MHEEKLRRELSIMADDALSIARQIYTCLKDDKLDEAIQLVRRLKGKASNFFDRG